MTYIKKYSSIIYIQIYVHKNTLIHYVPYVLQADISQRSLILGIPLIAHLIFFCGGDSSYGTPLSFLYGREQWTGDLITK